jgi:hypothetical protein
VEELIDAEIKRFEQIVERLRKRLGVDEKTLLEVAAVIYREVCAFERQRKIEKRYT